MNTSTYCIRHKSNPFATEKKTHSTTIFSPDGYTLNLLCNLSARAIRVLLIIAAKHDPETGVCRCSKLDMRRILSTSRDNLSHATGELVEAELLAKGKELDTYFLSPKVFRAVHITQ
ncbi:hypothetical protein [Spirosoma aerophilum]